jgi:hypothetical protein
MGGQLVVGRIAGERADAYPVSTVFAYVRGGVVDAGDLIGPIVADCIPLRRSTDVACVSTHATRRSHTIGMDQKSIGKTRWARARAASLWQQADDLDNNRGGDWRARATRRRGADRSRTEAARLEPSP